MAVKVCAKGAINGRAPCSLPC
uniref:Uncharacterized protein n=1 Tax=Anguilla anguilla TaxID=7936 RepID=A0A0E9VJL9_ANGAN